MSVYSLASRLDMWTVSYICVCIPQGPAHLMYIIYLPLFFFLSSSTNFQYSLIQLSYSQDSVGLGLEFPFQFVISRQGRVFLGIKTRIVSAEGIQ